MKELKQQIQEALASFAAGNLANNAIRLLNVLGYESDRTVELSPNTFESLSEYFDIVGRGFDPEKAKVKEWESIDIIFQLTEDDIKKSHSLFETKQYNDKIIESYLFFALSLSEDKYTRGDLVKITREINKLTPMPAMILFKYNHYLTIAVIDRRLHKRESTKDVLEKVTLIKDIQIPSPPLQGGVTEGWGGTHRAHIEILHDLSFVELQDKHRFTNFVELHNAWRKTLDTKELNKKFYNNLFYWYLWAVKNVKFPQIRPEEDLISDEAHQSESVIRLLTRLLFCWFMKEKQELIPKLLFEKKEVKKILPDFSPDNIRSSVYYRAILQNLFFATLSVPVEKRKYIRESFQGKNKDYGNQYVYRYQNEFADSKENLKLFKDIPFLNGGLFECLDEVPENDDEKEIRLDGFSSKEKKQAFVPDYLFWDEHKVDLSKELDNPRKNNETVYGIIDILNSYKFTIEENTPVEEEIALDPELLGKVFESLLAYYNPETKANARKQTGSFYTPREIVNYMVDESLIAAFSQSLSNAGINENVEPRLRDLISYNKIENPFSKKENDILIQTLENLKVLDPACGSGAFPMGILHKLVWVLQKIDPENKKWFESIIKRLPDYAQSEMRKKLEGENWDYLRKLGVIQKSIYGIDIQPIAIQIAKLRFFISLLVDQDIKGSVDDNFGLMPLPNLDFKLFSANTLIGAPEQSQAEDGALLFAQDEFFDKFIALTGQYFGTYEPAEKKKLTKKIEKLVGSKVEEKVKQIQSLSTHSDARFSKHVAEKNKALIEQKKQDAKLWESYNNLFKHESVAFFETKYFFPEVKEGFDIVIGNPPYVEHKKLKGIASELKKSYSTYSGTADLYVYFYENGIKNLRDSGTLVYITSNKFIKTSYGEKLRQYFISFNINEIIDFTNVHVFEALVASCIFSISKKNNSSNKIKIAFANDTLIDFPDLNTFIDRNQFFLSQSNLSEKIWQLENETQLSLKNKIETGSVTMKETGTINIYRGVTTGYNPAFIIDEEKRKELIKENETSKTIIKPLLQGRNIKKWNYFKTTDFLIFTRRGIQIKDFPAIKKHLQHFKEALEPGVGRKPGSYNWYEIQDNTAYYHEFEKEKIIWGLTADKWAFAYDNKSNFLPSNGYILTSRVIPIKYLLALMNSKLMEFYFGFIGIMTAGGAFTLKYETVIEFPIKIISEKQQQPFIQLVDQILAAKKQRTPLSPLDRGEFKNADTSSLEQQIDQMVYQLYGLTEDEIAIVEGKR